MLCGLVLSVALLLISLLFVSGDGDRSRFSAAIVSSCSPSDVFVDVVADSIGTSMAHTTDGSDRFDSGLLDTRSVPVGVFGWFPPLLPTCSDSGVRSAHGCYIGWVCILIGASFLMMCLLLFPVCYWMLPPPRL